MSIKRLDPKELYSYTTVMGTTLSWLFVIVVVLQLHGFVDACNFTRKPPTTKPPKITSGPKDAGSQPYSFYACNRNCSDFCTASFLEVTCDVQKCCEQARVEGLFQGSFESMDLSDVIDFIKCFKSCGSSLCTSRGGGIYSCKNYLGCCGGPNATTTTTKPLMTAAYAVYACNRDCADFCTELFTSSMCNIQKCCTEARREGLFHGNFETMDLFDLIVQFGCGVNCGSDHCLYLGKDIYRCYKGRCCRGRTTSTKALPWTTTTYRPTTTTTLAKSTTTMVPYGLYACNRNCADYCNYSTFTTLGCDVQKCCEQARREGLFQGRFESMDFFDLIIQRGCGLSCGSGHCVTFGKGYYYCYKMKCCGGPKSTTKALTSTTTTPDQTISTASQTHTTTTTVIATVESTSTTSNPTTITTESPTILPDGIYACNRRCNDFCTVLSGSVYKCQIQNCCVMSDIEGTFEDRFNAMDPHELITQFACGKSCGNTRCKRIESDTFFYCDHRKCCIDGAVTTVTVPVTTRPTTTVTPEPTTTTTPAPKPTTTTTPAPEPTTTTAPAPEPTTTTTPAPEPTTVTTPYPKRTRTTTQTPKPTTATTPTPTATTTTTPTPMPTTPNSPTPEISTTTNTPSPNTHVVCLACNPGNHTFCQEKFSYGTMCKDIRNTGGRYGCCVPEGGVVPPPVHVYAPDELRNIPRDVNAWGYSNREKKAIVDALNYNRSLIARGLYKVNGLSIPPAVGMYKMKWSTELEAGAQNYADYCFNVHSGNSSYLETLSKVYKDYIEGTGESAISRYFIEFQTYNYTQGLPIDLSDGMGHGYISAFHYVNEVGCGVRYCNDMFVHTVCHFTGVYVSGKKMYEAGPTCSKCETAAVDNGTNEPLECEEETGLCIPKEKK